jgi:eukaryotic-like serine/threonine-protein kinase
MADDAAKSPTGEEGAELDQIIAGKYRLTRMVGRGGMGSVWEGIHVSLGTRVAVKFIDAEHAGSKEAQSRFLNEARAAAKLRSKHVVQVHDQGVTEDGRPYIVMEFLAGEPLDRRLDRQRSLSLQETAIIVGQVCRALARAHEAGIVHRDLKPENVFIVHDDEDGHDIIKVVDFGIAKFTDSSFGMSSATRTGSVLGTPYYMSPEQARGLRSVDHRADLWSVGVIAFRCVAGQLPFQGEAIGDLLVKICTAPLPVPSHYVAGLPPAFDQWFFRALEREPAARFQSARELADGLAAAAGMGAPRAPVSSLSAPAELAANAATPWQGQVPTPGQIGTPQPGALTGAPITTFSPRHPSSGGKGLLLAALAAGGLLTLVAMLLVGRALLSGSGVSADTAAASGAVAEASASASEALPPEVTPTVADPPADAASSVEPPEKIEKPAAVAGKPPISPVKTPASTAPIKSQPPRPALNDPLGY